MNLTSQPMTERDAVEILKWRYPYPYDFYNNDMTDESMAEMLDGTYRVIREENEACFGFYCTGNSAQVPVGRTVDAYPEGFIDFGLGMRPAETGNRKGKELFTFVMEEIIQSHPNLRLRLTVAAFNKRAIHLYEKFGFIKEHEFKNDFAVFQSMVENKERKRLTEIK